MPKGKSYSEMETSDMINNELNHNPETLYKAGCIKWKGKTKDTDKCYTEIISSVLLQNLEWLNQIPQIDRSRKYKIEKESYNKKNTSRGEENFVKGIMFEKLNIIGEIKGLQIPIKNVLDDKAGKIDMLSYNHDNKTIFLIEFKYKNNLETLLRAVLEIFTYYKQINQEKLLNEFKNHGNTKTSNLKLKPIVLLYDNCNAAIEAKEMKDGKRPNLKELIEKLGIEVFILDYSVEKI
jgi:hypothetical protein